ncbi:MAG TPA: hypothetical protein VHE81_05225, partial [Lacipirellulaceae bacterium]|nr:hypothetical protein [Lacipirellulaceae bacterium]
MLVEIDEGHDHFFEADLAGYWIDIIAGCNRVWALTARQHSQTSEGISDTEIANRLALSISGDPGGKTECAIRE